jgi:hypothetical protein
MEMNFSRPGGTHANADDDPALKRRAIFGLSRWDECGSAPDAVIHRCQNQFEMDEWNNGYLNWVI